MTELRSGGNRKLNIGYLSADGIGQNNGMAGEAEELWSAWSNFASVWYRLMYFGGACNAGLHFVTEREFQERFDYLNEMSAMYGGTLRPTRIGPGVESSDLEQIARAQIQVRTGHLNAISNSLVLVFAHSAFEVFIESALALVVSQLTEPEIKRQWPEKKVSLSEATGNPFDAVRASILEELRSRKTLRQRIAFISEMTCKRNSEKFNELSSVYAYSADSLEACDKLRQDIIHRLDWDKDVSLGEHLSTLVNSGRYVCHALANCFFGLEYGFIDFHFAAPGAPTLEYNLPEGHAVVHVTELVGRMEDPSERSVNGDANQATTIRPELARNEFRMFSSYVLIERRRESGLLAATDDGNFGETKQQQ